MPVNLIDIQKRLPEFSAQAGAFRAEVAARQEELEQLLRQYAHRLDEVKARFERAAEVVPRLRCAVPLDEPLNAVVPMLTLPERYTALAADGSQINPSRHTRVPFCVINVSVVRMMRGSGQALETHAQSQLLDYEDVFPPNVGMLSEGKVAFMRDLREREILIELAGEFQPPAVAMVDGPLELIRDPQESGGFADFLDRYRDILARYQNEHLALLGYIDKSQSDLVGRLLELMVLSDAELEAYHKRKRRFAGVKDLQVMSALLQNPGERSAVFAIYSQTAKQFRDDLALHFFYLNVGGVGKPHLARVEVPRWVVGDRALVGLLQAVLTEQAHILGTRPYPYLLHRAHEEAVVSIPEHQHVEDMIVTEFERQGIPVDEGSYKQYHKDLPTGKTRYQG